MSGSRRSRRVSRRLLTLAIFLGRLVVHRTLDLILTSVRARSVGFCKKMGRWQVLHRSSMGMYVLRWVRFLMYLMMPILFMPKEKDLMRFLATLPSFLRSFDFLRL